MNTIVFVALMGFFGVSAAICTNCMWFADYRSDFDKVLGRLYIVVMWTCIAALVALYLVKIFA